MRERESRTSSDAGTAGRGDEVGRQVRRGLASNQGPPFEVRRLHQPAQELLEELAAYDREAFGETSLRSWDLNVIARAGALFVGYSGQEVAACCQLIRTYDEPAAMWVFGFWVRPALRGQGLGRKLLQAVVAELSAVGADSLLLSADPHNQPALRLYRSFGFLELETVANFYGPDEDRIIMRWNPRTGQGG